MKRILNYVDAGKKKPQKKTWSIYLDIALLQSFPFFMFYFLYFFEGSYSSVF